MLKVLKTPEDGWAEEVITLPVVLVRFAPLAMSLMPPGTHTPKPPVGALPCAAAWPTPSQAKQTHTMRVQWARVQLAQMAEAKT